MFKYYCMQYTDDAVVLRMAMFTSVVQVLGVKTSVANTPSAKGTQQPSLNSLVEVEEEELLHNNSLRRTYGEVCVSDDEGGDCGSSVCDADEDDM